MASGGAIKGKAKFLCLAGVAKPSPKLGQAIGPLGINMMQFCKEFNDQSNNIKPDVPMRVRLTAFQDRSFTFQIKPPTSTWFLKRAAGVLKGTDKPGHRYVGEVGIKYIYEIAKVKQKLDPDLAKHELEAICWMLMGSCKSIGLKVIEDVPPPDPIKIPVDI